MAIQNFKTVVDSRGNRSQLRIILLIACGLLSLGALVLPLAIRPYLEPLSIGDVSSQDIQAPRSLNFTSELLTEEARLQAMAQVSPVYLPTDPSIARRQIEQLRVALNFITTVRFDSYATLEQKLNDLSNLRNAALSFETSEKILALSDSRWQAIQQESLSVLEQVLRRSIRDDQLSDAKRSVPTSISLSIPEEQASIVADIVTPFVVPNSLFSADLTQKAQEEAAQKIEPVERTYIAGESIVRRGQVITPVTWETLVQFGLIKDENREEDIVAAFILVCIVSVFLGLYFKRRKLQNLGDIKGTLVIAFTFILFLYAAKIVIPNRAVIPYVFPLPAFALTLASLYTLELGLIFPLVLSILAAYGMPNSLDLTIFYILTSLVGVLALGKARRIANYFWSGIAIGLAGSAVILAYRLPDTITDWVGLATLIGTSFLNGLASASITLLLHFLFSQALGLTTPLQLMDLLRPDHPLLQFMLQNMPGSYQHSLQVANLAERAAESIGADALLTRAGAIYHDAGKALNPEFFIENQVHGKIDSHDDLSPQESAAIIIRHITEGVTLARKYRIPSRIQDFILEHHGTLMTRYQFAQAVKLAGDESLVDTSQFRYPGPSPRSKETAILMLADGVEARARAEIPKGEEELRSLIRKVIEFCEKEGQLENTNLTMRDLSLITESFITTLRNTYHPRIKYPEIQPSAKPAPENSATTPVEEKSIPPQSEAI